MKFTETVEKLNPEKKQMDMIVYCESAGSMMRLAKITQATIEAGRKASLTLVALVMGSDDYVANIGNLQERSQ